LFGLSLLEKTPGLTCKYQAWLKILVKGKNTLAYFAVTLVMKKYAIDT
jgi:hypothetical protein